VQCSAVQCSAVQCSAVQCSAVQCSAVKCSAVQYSAVQCSAVQSRGQQGLVLGAQLCWHPGTPPYNSQLDLEISQNLGMFSTNLVGSFLKYNL
jgi:hypothetical protein